MFPLFGFVLFWLGVKREESPFYSTKGRAVKNRCDCLQILSACLTFWSRVCGHRDILVSVDNCKFTCVINVKFERHFFDNFVACVVTANIGADLTISSSCVLLPRNFSAVFGNFRVSVCGHREKSATNELRK